MISNGDSLIGEAFQVGDRVKLILDKEQSLDNRWHGKEGVITDILFDDAASVTGDSQDNFMYKVQLENGEEPDIHFRRSDLKKVDPKDE